MLSDKVWLANVLFPSVMVLLTGTYSAVSTKILYNWENPGLDDKSNPFAKPYFLTFMMFVGEALCLFYKIGADLNKSRKRYQKMKLPTMISSSTSPTSDLTDPLMPTTPLSPTDEEDLSPTAIINSGNKPHILVFLVLSLFDLSATLLNGIGLQWVSASANQMLRGSMIFFGGVFTVLIFRKNLPRRRWLGIAIVMSGLVLVGGSGMLRGPGSGDSTKATSSQALLGVILVLSGSALNSLQGVAEEKLMKGTVVDPMEVVGWEGIWGSLVCMVFLLPIAQAVKGGDVGCAENTRDTLMQMTGSAGVMFVLIGYALALALMNNYSQVVSKNLSAVHRMLINTLRTVIIWVVNLFIFYALPGGEGYGERWDVYSLMQLGGFAVLVVGTVVYMTTPPAPVPASTDVQQNSNAVQ